ncbi:cupredoxin domain-containing protein [Clostridium chromiireducens]|uniref:cupredoxin domain-containing protein n=1 Tax=Clostridium chromiireducens TaxID=225345 RepID=UPI003AF61DF8
MNIRRKVNKAIYNVKCLSNMKYVRAFVVGAAILLLSSFILSFDMSANLKQNLSESEASVLQVNMSKAAVENGVQIIRITADNNGYTPDAFYVQKNMPVKLIIEGNQINSCDNGIIFPSLNIKEDLKPGENIIEFIPVDEDIDFSCWMGMIKGVIKVTDNIDSINEPKKL